MVINIVTIYLLANDRYKSIVAGKEIYYSIFKSKQKKKTKKILLGDSVGDQLFSNVSNNDPVNSLACNAAIGMVGQYILLNNYLQMNNRIDTVYMIFTPFSFLNNLDQIYTYHYFLKPFYNEEYKNQFTETVNKQIDKIPFNKFCRIPVVLTSNWAPNFVSQDSISYSFLSPISIEYLNKIKQLSIKYNFRIKILPTPVRFSLRKEIANINKKEILKTNLKEEFDSYFQNIFYLNDTCFVDKVHLKNAKNYVHYYSNIYSFKESK
jgi:hypothetical protein